LGYRATLSWSGELEHVISICAIASKIHRRLQSVSNKFQFSPGHAYLGIIYPKLVLGPQINKVYQPSTTDLLREYQPEVLTGLIKHSKVCTK